MCNSRIGVSVLGARFTDSFSSVEFTFSANTNKGTGTRDCDAYFAKTVLQLLGTDPRCVWNTPYLLSINLGADFTVEAQSALPFRPSVIRPSRR